MPSKDIILKDKKAYLSLEAKKRRDDLERIFESPQFYTRLEMVFNFFYLFVVCIILFSFMASILLCFLATNVSDCPSYMLQLLYIQYTIPLK